MSAVIRSEEFQVGPDTGVLIDTRQRKGLLRELRCSIPFTINTHTAYCANVRHGMTTDQADRKLGPKAIRPYRAGQSGVLHAIWEMPA